MTPPFKQVSPSQVLRDIADRALIQASIYKHFDLYGFDISTMMEKSMVSGPRTVLIAEDEPLIRLVLTEALEEEGYSVFEASNALEAVAIFAETPRIDAVITDVNMPGALNGFDLVDLVSAGGTPMAKIVMSGLVSAKDHDLPPGCRFLSKPYRLNDVIEELQTQLSELAATATPE